MVSGFSLPAACFSVEQGLAMGRVQEDIVRKACKAFDEHLKGYVIKNLKERGFEFGCDKDFFEFVSKRVTRVGVEGRPNEWELYVDYETADEMLVGVYDDSVLFSCEGLSVNASFGRGVGYNC